MHLPNSQGQLMTKFLSQAIAKARFRTILSAYSEVQRLKLATMERTPTTAKCPVLVSSPPGLSLRADRAKV